MARTPAPERDRSDRILDAVLQLLSEQGIAGVSMRSVAREAGVALGLVNYYFDDKHHLICAALRRIEQLDVALVAPTPGADAEANLLRALKRIAAPEYLTSEYLTLRMQLWSLARVHADFAEINTAAHEHYRTGLASLIRAARPSLTATQARRRAVDIDVLQNGVWLSALLGTDAASIRRSVERTIEIALGE